MNEEEEIKKKLMQQRLQQQLQESLQGQMQEKQMEEALKQIKLHVLDAKARERLNNLKLVKPDLAMQLEMYLAQLYQSGQIKGKITDEQMVSILKKISPSRDFSINRK